MTIDWKIYMGTMEGLAIGIRRVKDVLETMEQELKEMMVTVPDDVAKEILPAEVYEKQRIVRADLLKNKKSEEQKNETR